MYEEEGCSLGHRSFLNIFENKGHITKFWNIDGQPQYRISFISIPELIFVATGGRENLCTYSVRFCTNVEINNKSWKNRPFHSFNPLRTLLRISIFRKLRIFAIDFASKLPPCNFWTNIKSSIHSNFLSMWFLQQQHSYASVDSSSLSYFEAR